MIEASKNKFKNLIESHPLITLVVVFATGVTTSYLFFDKIYSNRIEFLKETSDFKLEQQIKECENEIRIKTIEIQTQERERYYLKIDEDTDNGRLLQKTLSLIEKKGKDEK